MHLLERLRWTASIFLLFWVFVELSSASFNESRHKRQNGANMFLPENFIIPGGEGDDTDWSDWTSPSECSRSCGGGVTYQTRECLRKASNGVPLCSGGNRKYFSCNTQDCPEEEPDFRALQCSRFDNVPFDGIYYNWVPYTNAPNPCELNCMPIGERFYFHQKAKVIDGTRCNDKDLDVCVDGLCQPVGCDMMLGSNAKEDKCRKCGGDGSTCKTIADTFTTRNLAAGYNDILLIPSGATNIRVQETTPSNNYLACRNLTSHYYLNGNWRIDFPRPMFFAGSWWNYQRKPAGFAAPDSLTCSGPTTESVYIVMLVQDRNVSISYEYSIPDSITQNSPDVYSWTHMEFEPCSASCGGGTQSRKVSCNNRITLDEVDHSLCDSKSKPAEVQECGKDLCPPQWVVGKWGKCSMGCGEDGIKNRTVTCKRVSVNLVQSVEDDDVCLQLVGNKPATTMECNRDSKNCPKYHLGPWRPCDKLCGEGKQVRSITCYIEENGRKKVLPATECGDKPESEKPCILSPCEGVDWIISPWSGCNACGQKTETRTALCGSKLGRVYSEEFCGPKVPVLSRECTSTNCTYQWFTSEWSKCSASCGNGLQSRVVLCGEFDGHSVKTASSDIECDVSSKPESERMCKGTERECPGQWFTGPWGACSKSCGGGERVREVLCLANGTTSSNCDPTKLAFAFEKCNTHPCLPDEVIPLTATARTAENEDYENEDCDDMSMEPTTAKISNDLRIGEGINVDGETTIPFSLITDELMLSDAPYSNDTTAQDSMFSTLDGSGDMTENKIFEGSGDEVWLTSGFSGSSTNFNTTDSISATTENVSSLSKTSGISGLTDEFSPSTTTEETLYASTMYLPIFSVSKTITDLSSNPDTSLTTSLDLTENTSASSELSSTEATSESLYSPKSDYTLVSMDSTELTSIDLESSSKSSTDLTTETLTTETLAVTTSLSESTLLSESTYTSSEASTSTGTLTTESMSTDITTQSLYDSISSFGTTTYNSTYVVTSTITPDFSTESLNSVSSAQSESTSDSILNTAEETETATSTELSFERTSLLTTSGETVEAQQTNEINSATETSAKTTTTTEEELVSNETEFTETIASSFTSSTETSADILSDRTTDREEKNQQFSTYTPSSSTESVILTETNTDDFWLSVGTVVTKEETGKSTPSTIKSVNTKKTKARKCKAKKTDCRKTQFGCCADKVTIAKGPFDEGCPIAKTCTETKFGCCLDGVSPAQDKNYKGCPKSQCAETLFGCCPDNFTSAAGEDNEGCPETGTVPPSSTNMPTDYIDIEDTDGTTILPVHTADLEKEVVKSCSFSVFGCCLDGITAAKGENFVGCDNFIDYKDCSKSIHGCCDDGRTSATGPDGQGCSSCTKEPFGCCSDQQTPAHGPLGEGCCLNSTYGCCPDNINYSNGPNFEGCLCELTAYGCCSDKKMAARGHNNEGCDCNTLQFGCCPDKITPSKGPKFEGCPCYTMQYGCCPDGITYAQGPHHYGCHCSQTEFKCCPDEKTPAKGPNYEGCTCLESKFGCCPDGISSAEGENFEGCKNVKEPRQKACGLPKETGNCSSFAIKYFFDTSYGACARFWYGGCGGNDNKFDTETECREICQEFKGKEACYLPKSSGPCTGYNKKWYFDITRNRCDEFNYGGCYGTSNRFDSLKECQSLCAPSESLPTCEQPMDQGPCEGDFERWFYDNHTDVCRPFRYGGCKGNRNNYPSEQACNYNCRQPGVQKDYCWLPKQSGDCNHQLARWYYDEGENKCMPFYYTGCGGNKNNFHTLESCEDHCPKKVAKDVCEIPAEVGECQNYTSMWYYDTKDTRCRQFYYGGCGGNGNKFHSEADCMEKCEKKVKTVPALKFKPKMDSVAGDICQAQPDPGSCSDYRPVWYFDATNSLCRQFFYGGCEGNGNRFETEEECAQHCRRPEVSAPAPLASEVESSCEIEADVGLCDQYVLMWHYNIAEGRCQQFYYGGCGGNGNKFGTEKECVQRCVRRDIPKYEFNTVTKADRGLPPNAEQICFLNSDSGGCSGNFTRWYYNSVEGLCDEFSYGGCGGNSNNFETEDVCHNHCYHVQTTCSLPPVRGRCNDSSVRWYFDKRRENCYEFEFSGCRGNRNNFVTRTECIDFCLGQPNQHEKIDEPVVPAFSLCELPAVAGDCDNHTIAWFYDADTMSCTAFTYSGCGGNGNRFESKEQCDRQCGEFKGVDVCNEPVKTGPCRQWQTRFYFNKESRTCEPFTYGGCDGTGNRFTLRTECESLCIAGQEPQTTGDKDICKTPVNSGKCDGSSIQERRWYYDDERGTCISFIYAGCAGNQNNFRSYESCVDFCARGGTSERVTEIVSRSCDVFEEECRQLRCPYGTRRINSDQNCTRCICENPCEHHICPEGQQCAVDVSSDPTKQFETVCRAIRKPGECPHFTTSSTNCERECYFDSDCRGENKCCTDGCGFVCVRPSESTLDTTRSTTSTPAVIYPGEVQAALEPKSPQEVDVQTSVGGIAVLRCFATGNPAPNVTWSRRNVVIDTNQGRYVLTSTGDLTIVQVRQTDSGTYVCVANNGLGIPVQREVQLQVTEPKNIPAYIFGDKNVTQIVTLNSPALVRCPAGGHPAPQVSWWRNRKRLGLIGDRFEMTRDYALVFHNIKLSDLGPYTCEAYNHRRRPVSMKVTLKAVGPARALHDSDAPFLQYVISPATVPTTSRPLYPYRPTRPSALPPPPVVVAEANKAKPVPSRAVLVRDPRNSYSLGSTVFIFCEVQGHPAPNVTWTKDGVTISTGGRIQITVNPHRLVINDATTEDTGIYGCTARNSFSYNTSEEKVTILSVIPVHPDCVDNRFFANCKLIVKGNYCKHQYYAKFCCRSCTLAGQLGEVHPNAV